MRFILPCTPEMNPAERIWKKLRVEGFCNEAFASQEKMVARLCATINHLAKEAIISLAGHASSCLDLADQILEFLFNHMAFLPLF